MLLAFYRIYRTYALDSTITFAIVSTTLYLLFRPLSRFTCLRLSTYVGISALTFSLAFQGVLLALLGGMSLIFSDPRHFLYFFCCQVAFAFLWSVTLLRGQPFQKLVYILILVAFMQLYRGVCAPLYDMEPTMDVATYATLDLLTAVGLYVCLAGLGVLFVRCKVEATVLLDGRTKVVMLYILLSLLASMLLPTLVPFSGSSFLVIALIMSDLPLIYYIFSRYTQNLEERRRLDAALSDAQIEWKAYQRSAELRDKIREERHELKNLYFRLLVMVREGKADEMEAELVERIGAVSRDLGTIETGSTYLDYLIATKGAQAKDARIPFHVRADVAEGFSFDERRAGTVLSNLIDNALEASRGERDPLVEVDIHYVRGYLRGRVVNRVSRDVLTLNPHLHSTKPDADAHGYGLKVVRKTLDECDGMLGIEIEDGMFVAQFMLPLDD